MKKILFFTLIAFITSSCSTSLSQKEIEEYTEKGKEITGATANSLMKNLSEKMEKGGIAEAVPFCNTMAHPLTDEMANKYDASIKRTSLSVRNEKNQPNEAELKILHQFETSFSNNEPLKPVVNLDESGKPHYYGPILLQKKCLACHGTVGQEVHIKTDSIIKSYYPNDKATGYKEGDLRGIWSITFNTKQ